MRLLTSMAAAGVLLSAATDSSAMLVDTLIDYGSASSVGNGSMFSDPAGVAAPAASLVNTGGSLSTNGFGRALIAIGTVESTSFTNGNFGTITDNRGVAISGWTNYRVFYQGGNSAMGFLEAGGRLGQPNTAFDGHAFANGNDFVLVSDAYTVPGGGNATDKFNIEALVGSDTGGDGSIGINPYLILDDTTFVDLGALTFSGNPASPSLDLDAQAITTDYTTVRLAFSVDGSAGERGLIDNVQLQRVVAVPEPGVVGFAMLSLAAFGLIGRRSKQD